VLIDLNNYSMLLYLIVAGAGLEPASEAYGASRKTFPNPPARWNCAAPFARTANLCIIWILCRDCQKKRL